MADLPVIDFIQERLAESEAQGGISLEARKGTAFYDLFIKPQELMLQPLISAQETNLTAQSVRRVLALTTPDSFDQDLVNDLAGNVYVDRDPGAFARATVRVFYETPLDREFPAFTAEFDSGTLAFFNESDFVITAAQMALQQSGSLFFIDVPLRAQTEGDSFNLDVTSGVTFVNDTAAVSATLLGPAVGGLPQQTNTELLINSKNSIGVRDLETVKGINAILRQKFPALREIVSIGMGDPEMQRDILFNAHVGGKTDVYLKTPAFQTLSTRVIGIGFDTTRQLHNNVHLQLTALSYSDPDSHLNTPLIVSGSVVVKDDVVETSAQFITASIPPVTGIDLSSGQWIKLKVDNGVAINIKVSGATVSATQRFEIINAINTATGLLLATPFNADQILIKSPTIGATSSLTLTVPDSPRTDGTLTLIPSAAGAGYPTAVFLGVVATVYIENIDFSIDYANGKIIKLLGSAILSGSIVAQTPGSGNGVVTIGSNVFQSPTPGAFSLVRPGDELNITSSTGVALGTYVVSTVTNNQTLRILGMVPTGNDASVLYNIVSQQVVVVDYLYNPLSVDVGPNVLLADGITRGIRPGRSAFTIKDVAFIKILTIEEIDSVTQEGLGTFLTAPAGFGAGGFGLGGFGTSSGGDFQFIVNRPTERFSAFEDSLIVFDPSHFGKSFKITYFAATEIASVHSVARNDLERVTGADVLPKNFVPAFVDISIGIRRDPTSVITPTDTALAQLIINQVQATIAGTGLKESLIEKILEEQGVDSVRTPFTMTATVINTDGSSSIVESTDILAIPPVVLPKQTDDFVTPVITHFYPGVIEVIEVA